MDDNFRNLRSMFNQKKKSNVIIGKISNCWVEVWSCM